MVQNFFSQLIESIEKRKSLLCVGLDPALQINNPEEVVSKLVEYNKKIIEGTHPHAACYKPNIAFYEVYGPEGLIALKKTLEIIPKDIPVSLDTKRSDIGNTAVAYAKSIFDYFGVNATTLNPYLGKESALPFIDYKEKGLFMLCRTSNPGAEKIQNLSVVNNMIQRPFYEQIAEEVTSWGPNIGLVVAGNNIQALRRIRNILPHTWFLAPGIGAQGGNAEEAIQAGLNKEGWGIIINVSRSIAQAESPGEKAKEIKEQINQARSKKKTIVVPQINENKKGEIIKGLIKENCFRTGQFTLKSGKISPFYIDLRRIISNSSLLLKIGSAYIDLLKDLDFDRIAGIPFAGIPIATSISLQSGKPMIFPRLQKKAHGTGNAIEGEYRKGEKVILIDDLITTGKSKFEALDILKQEELIVDDLVVLIERGKNCREELRQAGLTLHSYFSIDEFITECNNLKIIDTETLDRINKFLKSE